MTDMIVFH